ncbi:hypothetical protein WBJ53_23260 [Spirosoma sp. SC4-14]|uniref:hypothetical protein n=1 Tax=Spirosoma sp. SC4-14 TaxID=3128900 RepID=UPI0030D4D2A9
MTSKLIFPVSLAICSIVFIACNSQSQQEENTTLSQKGKIKIVRTNEVLMPFPTITDSLLRFETATTLGNMSLFPYEWRQLEFISKAQKSLIDREMDSINYVFTHEIHTNEGHNYFNRCHYRKLINKPLSVPYKKLMGYLSCYNDQVSGIDGGNGGQIKKGFSLIANGVSFYGLKDNKGNVNAFCIFEDNSDSLSNVGQKLERLLSLENLYLVDWVGRKVVDEKNIKAFLANR